MNVNDDETRLSIKRFIALVRWCQQRGQPMPSLRAVAVACEVDAEFVHRVIDVLKSNKIIKIRGGYAGKLHYRMVD